jgi:hypothetical protein
VNLERLARVLTICSFVMICWVGHRTLQARPNCITSASIASVQLPGFGRVENCRFHSRLEISWNRLNYRQSEELKRLASFEPPVDLFPEPEPLLKIELDDADPHAFELTRSGLRLGRAWLEQEPEQVRRALTMAWLRREIPASVGSQFQLEVLSDFLQLALNSDVESEGFSLKRDMKFSTVASSFAQYCRSPFVSLAHHAVCALPQPETDDAQDRVWGLRPLLAAGLWRIYEKLPLVQQLDVLERLRRGAVWPAVGSVQAEDVNDLAAWFTTALGSYAQALGIDADSLAIKRTLKELDVEAPTHWEVTFDLTHTPAWKEILAQLKVRAQYRTRERALVFTPEGEMALPSGLPVNWSASDVQSQKHVMIACDWPEPTAAVQVHARQLYARQTCAKLNGSFWD